MPVTDIFDVVDMSDKVLRQESRFAVHRKAPAPRSSSSLCLIGRDNFIYNAALWLKILHRVNG